MDLNQIQAIPTQLGSEWDDYVARTITDMAFASTDDPEIAQHLALAGADLYERLITAPDDEAEGAGPDYENELETADDARAELAEMETDQ